MEKITRFQKPKRTLTLAIRLVSLIFVILFLLCSCSREPSICELLDTNSTYTELNLSQSQKRLTQYISINALYKSGNSCIFHTSTYKGKDYGISQLGILVKNNTITKIIGFQLKDLHNREDVCYSNVYLKNFIGKNLLNMEPLSGDYTPENNADVIYVSQASYTSKAILYTINAVAKFYQSNYSSFFAN